MFCQERDYLFRERDLDRMPEGFSGKVRTAAAAKGGSLMLSPEPQRSMEDSFSYMEELKKTVE